MSFDVFRAWDRIPSISGRSAHISGGRLVIEPNVSDKMLRSDSVLDRIMSDNKLRKLYKIYKVDEDGD